VTNNFIRAGTFNKFGIMPGLLVVADSVLVSDYPSSLLQPGIVE
jgi:hypothetical protein